MSQNETKLVLGQSLEQPALTLVLTWKPPWWLSSICPGTGMLSGRFLENLLEQAQFMSSACVLSQILMTSITNMVKTPLVLT